MAIDGSRISIFILSSSILQQPSYKIQKPKNIRTKMLKPNTPIQPTPTPIPPAYKASRKQLSTKQPAKQPLILAPETGPAQQQANSRIANYLRTIAKLEEKAGHIDRRVAYCRQVVGWVTGLLGGVAQEYSVGAALSDAGKMHSDVSTNINTTSNTSSSISINSRQPQKCSYSCSSTKIMILQQQCLDSLKKLSKTNPKPNQTRDTNPTKQKCRQSAHLQYILQPDDKQSTKIRIQQLMRQREELYGKIQRILEKEQPYLCEKVLRKIRREVKRESKLEAIRSMEEICKQKQKWLQQTKKQISHKTDQKLLQSQVSANLQKMKQVMMQKIANNNYIQQLTQGYGQNIIDRNIAKINKSVGEINSIVKEQIEIMRDEELEMELQGVQVDRQRGKGTDEGRHIVEIDDKFVEEFKDLMADAYLLLGQPLSTPKSNELQNRYDKISNQINQLTNKKY